MSFPSPVPASVLAFVTTVHLALVVLRAHRSSLGPFSLAVVVSLLLAASPWLLSSPVGLAVGLAVHLAWFAACERLLPRASVPGPALVSAAAVSPPPVPITAAPVARRPREFVQVPVLSVFDEKRRYDTFFDIALGTMDLMSKTSTEIGAQGCDICLSPLTGPRSPSDLARAPSMVAEGEAAMLRALPRLKQLLAD